MTVRGTLAWPLLVAGLAATGCSRPRLELDPAVVSGCATGRSEVVRVHWDVRAYGAGAVRVGVVRPGGPMRTWIEAGPVGSAATGRWASDGLTFVLTTPEGREMARRTLESAPCPYPQKYE